MRKRESRICLHKSDLEMILYVVLKQCNVFSPCYIFQAFKGNAFAYLRILSMQTRWMQIQWMQEECVQCG